MPLYRGWRVAIAGAGINFLVGINYTWSIYASGLVDQQGWSHAQAALPYSFFLFCYAFSMVLTGRAQDYLGPRPVITLGSLFAGGAFIACALHLKSPFTASLLWGGLLGVGLACCFASTTPAAMKWFSTDQRGIIAGLVVTSTGIAALVMSPVIQKLVREEVGRAFLVSGFFLSVGILALARFVENPPMRIGDLRDPSLFKKPPRALFDPRLYHLWVMFFLSIGTGVTIASHLVNIMRVQAGYDKGYIAVAFFALCNAAGRIVGGFLSDRLGRVRSMTAIFGSIALMLVFVIQAQTPHRLIWAISLLALAYGGLYSVFPTAVASFFGDQNFGLNYGLVFTGLGAAGIFPYLAGVLFELQGHYISLYTLLLGNNLLALALSLRLNKSSPS